MLKEGMLLMEPKSTHIIVINIFSSSTNFSLVTYLAHFGALTFDKKYLPLLNTHVQASPWAGSSHENPSNRWFRQAWGKKVWVPHMLPQLFSNELVTGTPEGQTRAMSMNTYVLR